MSVGKIYVSDWGVIIRAYTGINLTGATSLKYKVIKPDGRLVEWTPTVESPATDGYLTYTTVSGDLDSGGLYKLNAYVVFASGVFTGETCTFRVYKRGE
jgi:hypothetical protein